MADEKKKIFSIGPLPVFISALDRGDAIILLAEAIDYLQEMGPEEALEEVPEDVEIITPPVTSDPSKLN